MPIIAAGTFIIGLVIAYLIFARPAAKKVSLYEEDLKAAKTLLDEAQSERESLKQQLADCQYKMKELEKDLNHAKKSS